VVVTILNDVSADVSIQLYIPRLVLAIPVGLTSPKEVTMTTFPILNLTNSKLFIIFEYVKQRSYKNGIPRSTN
jgi:hypothetical protein